MIITKIRKNIFTFLILILIMLASSCSVEINTDPKKDNDPINDNPSSSDAIISLSNIVKWDDDHIGCAIDVNRVQMYNQFAYNSSKIILNENQNHVYSPASFFMALSMETEGSDGDTYNQLINGLSVTNLNDLFFINNSLYKSNYYNDEDGKSKMANSYWVDNSIQIKKDYIEKLQDDYFAEGFSCKMSDALGAMAEWINKNTFDYLNTKEEDLLEFADNHLVLINTTYLENSWIEPFTKLSAKQKFNLSTTSNEQKNQVECDYMIATEKANYYVGTDFSMAYKKLSSRNRVYFVLPNEGKTIQDCFNDELLNQINNNTGKPYQVTLTMPLIDFQEELDLNDCAQSLGITDLFDSDKANLSKMSDNPLYVTKIKQIAHIAMDEEGIIAAAATIIGNKSESAAPEPFVEMNLNRPFFYFITDVSNLILFVGTVYNPTINK